MILLLAYICYFYVAIVLSVFRSVLLRKLHFIITIKSTKSNQTKNHNSCKVSISFTVYINFIVKAQPPNEELRLVIRSIIVSDQEIILDSLGFC